MKFLNDVAIILIIFLFTFPRFEPDFGIGLDTSYAWALNYLFSNDYNTLINLTYPIGPLGFLKMPTTEGFNLLISIISYSVLKIGFIILFFKLDFLINNKRTLSSILLLLIASLFANIDLLIIGSCFILILLTLKKPNIILFSISVFLAVIGFFIKSSIGISSFSIIFISIIITYFDSKSKAYLLKQIGITFLILFSLGLVIFKGNILLLLNYCFGIIRLSGGFSDTLSLHPTNNWVLLLLFLSLILSLPVFIKNLNFRYVFLLLLFPLFASWKHALSREDMSHYYILISFLFVFGSIICVSSLSKKTLILAVFSISIMLLYSNMSYLPKYQRRKIEITGINNFIELLEFKKFKAKYSDISKRKQLPNILDTDINALIGNATIDVYPWEHSYIAANNLNWKPRKTLEIGASTSRWASLKSSENYKVRENSPNFVLFHLIKDKYNGRFGSIDQRYILNDEPNAIFNILNNYSITEKNKSYLLFKKNNIDNFSDIVLETSGKSEFGKWIEIPDDNNEITRLKVISKNTFLGHLKKFIYKEEAYFIDYMFEDGKVLTYRYIPSTAVDGLWCNPFIMSPESGIIEQKTTKVRLRNSNSSFISNNIQIQIEKIGINREDTETKHNYANDLFLKLSTNRDSTIINQMISFDDTTEFSYQKKELTDEYFFSKKNSNLIYGSGYSYTYDYSLDSLWQNLDENIERLQINVDVKFLNVESKAKLIISLSGSSEDFWIGENLNNNNNWDYCYKNKIISRNKHRTGNLKIYVWNEGTEKIFIDDLRINLKTINNTQYSKK